MDNYGRIYALICPVEKEVRYVGKTLNKEPGLMNRYKAHLSDASWFRRIKPMKKQPIKCIWINWLFRQKLRPIIKELAVVPVADLDYWERFFITAYDTEIGAIVNGLYSQPGRNLTKERYSAAIEKYT